MKKIYFVVTLLLVVFAVRAADKQVMIVSANAPGDDPIIKAIVDSINAIDGVTAEHVLQADYNLLVAADFLNYHCVLLTENGGSSSMTTVQDEGWPVPVVSLKTYALYKGTNPIMAQAEVDWYAEKDATFDDGDGTLLVQNADDILSCYAVEDAVDWTTGFNDETGAGEAHVQAFDLTLSTVTEVSNNATLLAKSKWHEDNTVQSQFMWKVDENGLTKNLFIWGVHHEYLQYATSDFYLILMNATRWAMGMDMDCGGPSVTENVSASQFKVYPNPMSAVLHVDNAVDISNISIIDITGKIIVDVQNTGLDHLNINTGDLVDGIYLIKLETEGGKVFTEKLVK